MANKLVGKQIRSSVKIKDFSSCKEDIRAMLSSNFHQDNISPDLSIIIPAYNEENTIQSMYSTVKEVMNEIDISYEVLIINDGSTDSTNLEIVNSGVKYINLKQNMRKGNALKSGFKASKGKYLLTIDADGSHQDKDIKNVIVSFFNSNLHMLIGSRFMTKPKERITTPTNIVGNKLFTILLFLISRKVITDSQSGLRIFDKQIIQNKTIHSNGYEIESELTALALGMGYRVNEISIDCKPRIYGSSNLHYIKDGIKICVTLIRAFYHCRKIKS